VNFALIKHGYVQNGHFQENSVFHHGLGGWGFVFGLRRGGFALQLGQKLRGGCAFDKRHVSHVPSGPQDQKQHTNDDETHKRKKSKIKKYVKNQYRY
jgi:hypothetical protein